VSDDRALNAILLELRGPRADLAGGNQRLLAAQLLVGRIQMQEQRIAYVDAQATALVRVQRSARRPRALDDVAMTSAMTERRRRPPAGHLFD
jgi:hypothetical protein